MIATAFRVQIAPNHTISFIRMVNGETMHDIWRYGGISWNPVWWDWKRTGTFKLIQTVTVVRKWPTLPYLLVLKSHVLLGVLVCDFNPSMAGFGSKLRGHCCWLLLFYKGSNRESEPEHAWLCTHKKHPTAGGMKREREGGANLLSLEISFHFDSTRRGYC